MADLRRPVVVLPKAPEVYDAQEQREFRRILMQAVGESVVDAVRPSLDVKVTPSSTSYEIVVTWIGTMSYRIDGGSSVAGGTSPQTFNVTRNDYLGAPKAYVFTVTNSNQTTSNTVIVPPVDTNAAAAFSIGAQTANSGTNTYSYTWTATGMPSGTTFNLLYQYTNTAGTLVEEGVVNGATSGGTVVSGGTIGASPTYRMTVNAIKDGVVISTQFRVGTFTT